MAVSDDKIADCTVNNYAALNLKHPQRETCSNTDPTDTDCSSISECFALKALTSFPNGSNAGLDDILSQVSKDLTAKSNGQTGLNFLRALTNLVNVILEGKVPFELRPYFFGAKLRWKARWRTSCYRCRQYFPLVVRKVCQKPSLRLTSIKVRRSKNRCFTLFDRKPPAQRKRDFENWLWKRFQIDKPTIHAWESLEHTL